MIGKIQLLKSYIISMKFFKQFKQCVLNDTYINTIILYSEYEQLTLLEHRQAQFYIPHYDPNSQSNQWYYN